MPEQNNKFSIGGSVENSVVGNYTIDVKAVLSEAWQTTVKSRMSINIALFGIFIFGMMISYITSSFFGGIEQVFEDPELLQLINVIVTIAVWPFIAGVEMMGILHAINKPTQSKMVFSFLERGSWVALCALLTSLLVSLGFQLLFIPGVILAVLLSLTVPLVVEKKLSPVQAIVLSIKSLRFKLAPLFLIYALLIMSLVFLLLPFAILADSSLAPIGIILFIFGLSYLAPWYYNIKGILYREIFGVFTSQDPSDSQNASTAGNTSESNDSDGSFSA